MDDFQGRERARQGHRVEEELRRTFADELARAEVFKMLEESIDGSIERSPVEGKSGRNQIGAAGTGPVVRLGVRECGGNISRRDQPAATGDRCAVLIGQGQRAAAGPIDCALTPAHGRLLFC